MRILRFGIRRKSTLARLLPNRRLNAACSSSPETNLYSFAFSAPVLQKNEFFSVLAKSLTVVGSERPFVRIGVSQITAHYPPITKRITLSSRPIHGEVSDSKLRREESK
jgi:hypothetical protein